MGDKFTKSGGLTRYDVTITETCIDGMVDLISNMQDRLKAIDLAVHDLSRDMDKALTQAIHAQGVMLDAVRNKAAMDDTEAAA
jgi:hypothetical protein